VAGLDVHVQAVDHPNALDQAVGVAAVLFAHQLDFVRVVLVQNAVIENQAGIVVKFDVSSGEIPDISRADVGILQVAIYGIVRKPLMVIRKIGLRVVDLCGYQKLAVVSARGFHG
jgi:hypothetical protein